MYVSRVDRQRTDILAWKHPRDRWIRSEPKGDYSEKSPLGRL